MSSPGLPLGAASERIRLERALRRLADHLDAVGERLDAGDEAAWGPYHEAVRTWAALLPHVGPERGALMTTAQMAAKLGVTPKTLLKHKAAGRIRPAIARGKLLRWSGKESLHGTETATGLGNRAAGNTGRRADRWPCD